MHEETRRASTPPADVAIDDEERAPPHPSPTAARIEDYPIVAARQRARHTRRAHPPAGF